MVSKVCSTTMMHLVVIPKFYAHQHPTRRHQIQMWCQKLTQWDSKNETFLGQFLFFARKTWFFDHFHRSMCVIKDMCAFSFQLLAARLRRDLHKQRTPLSATICTVQHEKDERRWSEREREGEKEKEGKKNWKQNLFLIRAFSTFIQFMILGTCSVEIIYSVMAERFASAYCVMLSTRVIIRF